MLLVRLCIKQPKLRSVSVIFKTVIILLFVCPAFVRSHAPKHLGTHTSTRVKLDCQPGSFVLRQRTEQRSIINFL